MKQNQTSDICAGNTVILSRRTMFSCAHLYQQPKWSEQKNQDVFGACYTAHGHGHNYTLEVFLEGPIQESTGLVVNLLDTDALLRKVVAPLEHQHLNFDVPYFQNVIPTTEEIAYYLWRQIQTELQLSGAGHIQLARLRLFETDDIWVEVSAQQLNPSARQGPGNPTSRVTKPGSSTSAGVTSLTRFHTFRALHNLENSSISSQENERLYGMCYRKHGHHYQLQVTVSDSGAHVNSDGVAMSDSDNSQLASTGLVMSRDRLDQIISEQILQPYDGVFLNDYFANTSGEALVCYFFQTLDRFLGEKLQKVALQETRKNYFEHTREQFKKARQN